MTVDITNPIRGYDYATIMDYFHRCYASLTRTGYSADKAVIFNICEMRVTRYCWEILADYAPGSIEYSTVHNVVPWTVTRRLKQLRPILGIGKIRDFGPGSRELGSFQY
jgi:hypothetical protein